MEENKTELGHTKTYKKTCATSEDKDCLRSLISLLYLQEPPVSSGVSEVC